MLLRLAKLLALVALMAFSSSNAINPLDNLNDSFSIKRPFSVTNLTAEQEFICNLNNHETITKCQFSSGELDSMIIWTVDATHVLDQNGKPVDGVESLFNSTQCGIKLNSFKEENFGWWSCWMNDDRKGTFKVNKRGEWPTNIRLAEDIEVINYDVTLEPDLEETFTTEGTVKITLNTKDVLDTSKDSIKLNIYQIIINEGSVSVTDKGNNDTEIQVAMHEYDIDRQLYVIHLEEELAVNNTYEIEISFTSILNDDLSGFYRSKYFDVLNNNTETWLGVTQFETTGARKSFPCFDEPDKKATFDVTLIHSNTTQALSNMRVNQSTPIQGQAKIKDTFNRSVKMPTYLLAFLVADFSYTANPGDGTYKIWHQKSKAGQAEYAADIGPGILKFYEEYFDLKYPLTKMDMAAIPDFSAGAMENWGLITYRETLLLYADNVSAATDKERVTEVMAHELAHQWFGNIVTMKWWTDLWLNEGFATYVQYLGTTQAFPESQIRDRVIVNDLQEVFGLDALESSKAITVEVTNPDFDAYFGRIAYAKGGCLLRMIENFLTEEKFKQGVRSYLKKFAYGNAATKDLWDSLTEAASDQLPSNLTIASIMNEWTTKAGYPVVTFDGKKLTQTRFFLNATAHDEETLWKVPISIAYPMKEGPLFTTAKVWLTEAEAEFEPEERPYIINVKESGYYRVNYDQANWDELIAILNSDYYFVINRLNRAQLVDDALNLARSGRLNYDTVLTMLKYLSHEEDYIPWEAASSGLSYLLARLRGSDNEQYLKTFLASLIKNRYESLGFTPKDEDQHLDILGRSTASSWMCKLDNEDCIQNSLTSFENWMVKDEPVPADIKDVVYATGIRKGDSQHWDFMYQKFQAVEIDSERQKYIVSLGASEDETILEKYLNMTINRDESGIRLQDCMAVFRVVSVNRVGRDVIMAWMSKYYEDISVAFGDPGSNAGGGQGFANFAASILGGFASTANSEDDLQLINEFVEAHQADLQGEMSKIEDSLKSANLNIAWNQENSDKVVNWLKKELNEDNGNDDDNSASALSSATLLASIVSLALVALS